MLGQLRRRALFALITGPVCALLGVAKVELLLTLPLAIAASDLALLIVRRDARVQFALGVAAVVNVIIIIGASCALLVGGGLLLYYFVFGLWVLVVLAGRAMLVASIFKVHGALPSARAWRNGIAASPAVFVIGAVPAIASAYVNWHPRSDAAMTAIHATRAIVGCSERYAADHNGRFPSALSELGSGRAGCLGAELTAGRVRGWALRLEGGDRFRVELRERTRPFSTYRTLSGDASGVLRILDYPRRDGTRPEIVVGDVDRTLYAIGACIEAARASIAGHPPRTLLGIAAERSACTALRGASWPNESDPDVAETRRETRGLSAAVSEAYRYTYHPWLSAHGIADSVDVSARPVQYGVTGIVSYLLTPGRDVYATPQDRPATQRDSLVCRANASYNRCGWTIVDWAPVETAAGPDSRASVSPAWEARLDTNRFLPGTPIAPFVMNDGTIVTVESKGTEAFAPDGKSRWIRRDLTASIFGRSPEAANTLLLVIDAKGVLHAVDPNGRDAWETPLRNSASVRVVAVRGTIYAVDSTNLVALTMRGDKQWEAPVGRDVRDLLPAADGGVYVEHGSIVAFGEVLAIDHVNVAGAVDRYSGDSIRACPGAPHVSLWACYGAHRLELAPDADRRFVDIPDDDMNRVREELVPLSNLRNDGTAVGGWSGVIRSIGPDLVVDWRIPNNRTFAYDDVVFAGDYAAVQRESGYPYRGLVGIDATGRERWVAGIPEAAGPYGRVSALAVGRDSVIYLVGGNAVLYAVRPPRGALPWPR